MLRLCHAKLDVCSTAREPCTVSALYAFVTKWHHFVLEISLIVKNPACAVHADLASLHLCPELGALVLETDVVLMFGSARGSQKYNIHLAKVHSESLQASLPSRSFRQGTVNLLSYPAAGASSLFNLSSWRCSKP